jgi:capping protein alpha
MVRAELAKSLAAYAKNHYPTGQSSVNCSQYPFLPPAPRPSDPIPETVATKISTSDISMESSEPKTASDANGIVTDVVAEQVGAGSSEPAPTPAVGDEEAKTEEVAQPGGLEKVDELVEEIKEVQMADEGETPSEKTQEPVSEDAEKAEVADVPEVVEVDANGSLPSVAGVTSSEPALKAEEATSEKAQVERKQERVENPTFTLEIVGNRYKTDAFWSVV